jgi:hypothetical protein
MLHYLRPDRLLSLTCFHNLHGARSSMSH